MQISDADVARLVNLRDVAARIPLLRTDTLLRSDAPHHGDADPDHVAWPPNVVIDLRGPSELTGTHPLAHVSTVRRVWLFSANPVPPGTEPGAEDVPRPLYHAFFTPEIGRRLVDALREIAGSDGTVLIHCAGGKDRTGIVVALALRLVGVDRDAILADYALTNDARRGLYLRHLAAGIVIDDDDNALKTHAEHLAAVLDHWDAHPGGLPQWFRDHGGDDTLLDLLRRRLLLRPELAEDADWLDAALAQLRADGPRGLSPAAIAALLGATTESAPRWARDPAELAHAVLDRAVGLVTAALDEHGEDTPAALRVSHIHSRAAALRTRYRLDEPSLPEWGAHEPLAREAADRISAAVAEAAGELWAGITADMSAVFLYVPDLEPVIDPYRSRLNRTTHEWGIPGHISILYPFLPAIGLTDDVVERIRTAVADARPFTVAFDRLEWLDEIAVWLMPADPAPVADLIRRMEVAFPGYRLYGSNPYPPHLTLATTFDGGPDALAQARAAIDELTPLLPLVSHTPELVLAAGSDEKGSWRIVERIPLGSRG